MIRRTMQYGTLNQTVPLVVPAAQTKFPASKVCTVFSPTECRVDILVTAAASGTTLILQQSPGPDHTGATPIWTDVKTATIGSTVSTDTYFTIQLQTANTADQSVLPLAESIRVVTTTPGGGGVTIAKVLVLS